MFFFQHVIVFAWQLGTLLIPGHEFVEFLCEAAYFQACCQRPPLVKGLLKAPMEYRSPVWFQNMLALAVWGVYAGHVSAVGLSIGAPFYISDYYFVPPCRLYVHMGVTGFQGEVQLLPAVLTYREVVSGVVTWEHVPLLAHYFRHLLVNPFLAILCVSSAFLLPFLLTVAALEF
jgi:hypothetical protein